MELPKPFKLQKLRIQAFKNATRTRKAAPPSAFEAMFNPASYKQSYAILWGKQQGLNTSGREVSYSRSEPSQLELDLVLDGTGVAGLSGPPKSVKERVEDFLKVTYRYNGDIHEPNYLLAEWGALVFPCRLLDAAVTYTTFDRDGTPLRAELKVTLIGDKEVERRVREEQKSSPDLTHRRLVVDGDTLPLLTRQVYGSPDPYPEVARFNELDDFRRLKPGTTIHFPPLERPAPTE